MGGSDRLIAPKGAHTMALQGRPQVSGIAALASRFDIRFPSASTYQPLVLLGLSLLLYKSAHRVLYEV